MDVRIAEPWKELLKDEFEKDYFAELVRFVKQEYAHHTVYPAGKNVFRAFDMCAPADIKVVIIGQDPYHGPSQANGLCFSVNDGIEFPPSLRNIFEEIHNEMGTSVPSTGNLDRWAQQGVLLLNSVLTVRASSPTSHANKGWEQFTDAVINAVNSNFSKIVYMLWGSYAQKKGAVIDPFINCILKTVHPSPLSAYRGFMGCGHFVKANEYLESVGKTPINW